jgi:hypothetical protein
VKARVGLALALLVLGAAGVAAQTGLPQRAPEPRTMREFWPVFLFLTALWLAVVITALRVSRPYGKVAEKVERLRRAPGEDGR